MIGVQLQGEQEHRLVKRLYGLTNKRSATKQIANRYQRLKNAHLTQDSCKEDESDSEPELRYHISKSRNRPIDIFTFVRENRADPAFKVFHLCFDLLKFLKFSQNFFPNLQTHLLGRILGQAFDGDENDAFTDGDRNTVRILGNRIFATQTCRVNYTTYDFQRAHDTINPTSHPDIMLCSPESGDGAHLYWYARVIGIFHALVSTTHPRTPQHSAQHMDFLFVRWFGVQPGFQSGFQRARLPKIGFVESSDDYAFGFVDPSLVIRGCHLIPSFIDGRTKDLLPYEQSYARILDSDDSDDWTNFYVSM
jgi:hypothetical protein